MINKGFVFSQLEQSCLVSHKFVTYRTTRELKRYQNDIQTFDAACRWRECERIYTLYIVIQGQVTHHKEKKVTINFSHKGRK